MTQFFLSRVCWFVVAVSVPLVPLYAADSASSFLFPTNAPAIANSEVTLDGLVKEALERNPELKFYQTEMLAARGERKAAGLWANPEVSSSVGQKRVVGGGLSGEGVAWSVSVSQPFEWPGRIGLRKAIADRNIDLAELGLGRFRMVLAGRTRALAYNLFVAQEKAAAAREVADRFQALREVLVQRDPSGLTPLLETRVIEATELTMQRKASEAALAIQAALLEMNQLRGEAPTAHLSITPTPLAFRPAEDSQILAAMARTNNFELRMRATELAQQGFQVELAKNERYPAISVGPMVSIEQAGERQRIVGIGFSAPLPMWNRNSGNIETAKARQVQAEVSWSVARREIERKIVETVSIYETKRLEMAKWRPDAVQHFKEAAEIADRHYRLGAVPVSTYVELQKQYLEAVESLLDTKREALEAAAQLELLTGMPLPLVNLNATEEKQ